MTFVPKETPAEQYVLAVVFSVIATIFVGLRFYVRRLTKAKILLDDWIVLSALIFTYATAIFMIIGTALGNEGQHTELSPQGYPLLTTKYRWFLKMLWAGQLSQTFAIGLTKVAVLLFYRRIFLGKIFNIITWILLVLVVSWIISYFFANLLQCIPISVSFENAAGQGNPRCINAIPMYFSQVYSDMALDCLILIIPLPYIWNLNLPRKQKFALLGIFLLGMLAIAASCAKAVVFNLVGSEIKATPDVSYFLTPIVYWPMIESSLQIMAACLPLLRPLFVKPSDSSRLNMPGDISGPSYMRTGSEMDLFSTQMTTNEISSNRFGDTFELDPIKLPPSTPQKQSSQGVIMVEREYQVVNKKN